MDTPDLDIRSAANAARQLARQAWDLQSLHGVLERLSSDDQELKAMPARIATLKAQEDEQRRRHAEAQAQAASAEARAEAAYAEQIEAQEKRVADLKAEIHALEQRHKDLTTANEALDRENKATLERLRAAVA